MKGLSIKHAFALMPTIQPMIEMFLTGKAPKALSDNIYIKEQEENGKKFFLVVDITKYATKEEAEKHVSMQQKINDLTVTFQKDLK